MFDLKHWIWILIIIAFVVTVHSMQGMSRDEDDDIISEVMSSSKSKITKSKRNGVPFDYNLYHAVNQRAETPGARAGKSAADAIVGDVNKYGLWEYTADNTGMGDQIGKLMRKVQTTDIALSANDLEKQASKMNEQINKYAEGNMDSASPTIDPMETPIGYHPTAHQLSYAGPDLSPINHNKDPSSSDNNVDVVTIPNSMTIEDEHGNNLDAIQRFSSDIKPSKQMTKSSNSNFPTHSRVVNNPTSKQLRLNSGNPTTGLTQKLLVALKSSKSFRNSAKMLLASPGDTDTDTFQKQRKLALFMKAYERMKDQEAPKSKIKIPRYEKVDEVSDVRSEKLPKDIKLLSVIKKLIQNGGDHTGQRNQLHDLLTALKTTEKDAAKTEQEFYDTSGISDSKDEKSPSDPYLKHFKEFILKHKHPNQGSDEDQPLGTTSSASPLMGYLEQETAAVNNIKDAGEDPKAELDKLEKMLVKQKSEQEEIQKQHDKIMIEQFKKLLKEGKENKEEGENNKHSEEEKNQEASKINGTNFGDEVYNTMKSSAEYQEFAEPKENKFSKGHTKDSTDVSDAANSTDAKVNTDVKETTDAKESPDTSGAASNDSQSFEEQLKEIEMQKQLLKIKEYKVKQLSKENEENKIKENKKEEEEDELKKVDHLLHLANPKKFKQSKNESNEDTVEFQKVQTGNKIKKISPDDAKSKSEDTVDNNGKDYERFDSTKNHNGDIQQKLVESSNLNPSSEKAHSHDLQSEEQFKIVDAHDEHPVPFTKEVELSSEHDAKSEDQVSNDTSKTAESSHLNNDDNIKETSDDDTKSTKKTKAHRTMETLGLPINNPSPKDDSGMEPHANFHHTFHSKDAVDAPSKASSNVISPIHSPLHSDFHHTRGPTLMNVLEESRNVPPAGMGKPTLNAEEGSHFFPIEEPQLVSFHTDTNHHALKTNFEAPTIDQGEPNTVANLLKHKTIPNSESAADESIVLPPKLHLSPYARIIKPKYLHPKMIDVAASKKGFGKLPKKPKSYLLKELRAKLKQLAIKRHDVKLLNRLNSHSKNNHTITPDINAILLRLNNTRIRNSSRRHFNRRHSRHNNSVLIPGHITNRIITINHTQTNQSQSNVIVPGSDNSRFLGARYASAEMQYKGIDPKDITRSVLPQVKNQSKSHRSIEEVFNMLGSEDQIYKRNAIARNYFK